MSQAIDLSQLPSAQILEPLDYERILEAMLADLRERSPDFSALVESEPAYKILQVAAYRELLLRQRINEAARSVMVAYARGADLDNLAALFGVQRQLIRSGNPEAIPPVEPVYESDDRLRSRVPLSLEAISTAGPKKSYVFHALSASAHVKDVAVQSPEPGRVVVSILSMEGNGGASPELLETVRVALNAEQVRPLTDHVLLQSADIVEYQVEARLTFLAGPGQEVVLAEARRHLEHYTQAQHALGSPITLSGIYAALHQPGVENVELASPTADLEIQAHQAPFASSLEVTA